MIHKYWKYGFIISIKMMDSGSFDYFYALTIDY